MDELTVRQFRFALVLLILKSEEAPENSSVFCAVAHSVVIGRRCFMEVTTLKPIPKKPYQQPHLIIHGTVSNLTLATRSGVIFDRQYGSPVVPDIVNFS